LKGGTYILPLCKDKKKKGGGLKREIVSTLKTFFQKQRARSVEKTWGPWGTKYIVPKGGGVSQKGKNSSKKKKKKVTSPSAKRGAEEKKGSMHRSGNKTEGKAS